MGRAGYFPQALAFYEHTKRHAPAGVRVGFPGGTQAPLTTAVLLRGEGFLLDLVDEPGLARRFLETLTASAIGQRELARRLNGQTPSAAGAGFSFIDVGTDPYLTIADCRQVLRVGFLVQMKTSAELLLSTPARIRQRYAERVAEGAPSMLVELCRGVPEENLRAFIGAARQHESGSAADPAGQPPAARRPPADRVPVPAPRPVPFPQPRKMGRRLTRAGRGRGR